MRLIDCGWGRGPSGKGATNGQRKHQRASRSATPELSRTGAVEGIFSKRAIYAYFEEGVSLMSEPDACGVKTKS